MLRTGQNIIAILCLCHLAKAALVTELPRGYKDWSKCDAGKPYRADRFTAASSYAQIYTSMRLECDGWITQWWFYNIARITGTVVYLTVWQKLDSGPDNYFLIGYNSFNASVNGWIAYEVEPENRIRARPGFYIGFHYETFNLAQDKLVIPHIDLSDGDVEPYELYHVSVAPFGHSTILEEMDRYRFVNMPYGELRSNRAPALLVHVTRDILGPQIVFNNPTSPGETVRPTTQPSPTTPWRPWPVWPTSSTASDPWWTTWFSSTWTPATQTTPATTATTTPTDAPDNRLKNFNPSVSAVCFLPKNTGNATCAEEFNNSPTIRWFFDSSVSQRCQMFVSYTGRCVGNPNNFANHKSCSDACERPLPL